MKGNLPLNLLIKFLLSVKAFAFEPILLFFVSFIQEKIGTTSIGGNWRSMAIWKGSSLCDYRIQTIIIISRILAFFIGKYKRLVDGTYYHILNEYLSLVDISILNVQSR